MATSSGNGEKQKIGVMGGTFDPIHNGHVQVALEAQKQLELRQVIFIPAGQPWMKSDRQITIAEHRVAMVRLAIRQYPGFSLSTMEIERQGPTLTVDTLRELNTAYDGRAYLFLILSWNTLTELPKWKEPEEIVRLATIVTAPRPGYKKPDLDLLEGKIPGITHKLIWLDKPVINISATSIRARVAHGKPISDMVAAKVAGYIRDNQLYAKPTS